MDEVKRDAEAIECPRCHGYAERVNCTQEEILSDFNCDRAYECCVRAFVCKMCGKRIVCRAEAPEADWD